MAATLISETLWHEGPGYGPTDYAISFLKAMVPSPYYRDGRDVPDMGYYVSSTPGEDLVPGATIDTAGPASSVAFSIQGVFPELTGIQIAITRAGGANGNYNSGPLFSAKAETADEVAAALAAIISEEADMTAVASGDRVTVTMVAPVTALTITSLTVL